MGSTTACPRCRAVFPGPLPAGGEIACDTCGHRWTPPPPSDEYLPAETAGHTAPNRPLTERRTPPRQAAARITSPGDLPFDRLEAESHGGKTPRQASDLAFRPVVDTQGGRSHCPVCGHSFIARPGAEDQQCPQCGTAFSRSSGRLSAGGKGGDRLIGRTLRGCQIDRKLGEGGMGAVYHARQLSLDRSVAIKVLPPELARNRNFIQRFEREAKSLARINHANILQIYDFGEDQALGIYFMVIEYVDGWDLGEVMRRQPTLSQIETLDILRQALLGLEQAAEKGVIHRDIKPDNLMIGTSGLCKVSDFGLAKGNSNDNEVTSVGVRVGTPAFMSPEQCDGVDVDSRSDVYNLGCTAYLMLTGCLPFDGETPFAIMLKHKVDPVPSPAAVRSGLDPQVDRLIRRMLAKRPSERCDSLRELIDEAERLLVELTGTASVLRKTNGPIRALIQSATGQGSSGKRAASNDAEAELPAPRREPPPRPAPAASPAPRPPPAPAAGAAPPAIPEWLRPVDGPTAPAIPPAALPAAPPAAAAAVQAPVGSRTGPAPAISGRSLSPVGSRTGPQPAMPTPFPGLATPYPGSPTPYPGPGSPSSESRRAASSSSSSLQPGAFDRARERGIRAEIAAIAAGAERLAGASNWSAAASEYKRAASLARDGSESRRLVDLAASAAGKARFRRRLRAAGITLASLVLVAVNLWIWPPVVHNLLAERERTRLEATSDPVERTRLLKDFAAANQGGWQWYRILFLRGYDVPAAAAAAAAAEYRPVRPGQPTGTRPPRREQGPQPTAADPAKLAADPAVTLQRVVAAARAGGPAAAAILAEAERQLADAAKQRSLIDGARSGGRHGDALDQTLLLLASQPRAGELLDGLPLPGRVRAIDGDTGAPLGGVRISVDGVPLSGEDGRFCRATGAETRIEVVVPGYAAQRIAVLPSPERDERIFEVRLSPAPVWRTVASERRPEWQRLFAAGTAAVQLTPDGALLVDTANGNPRPLTIPGTRLAPWWSAAEGGWCFATQDGEQRLLPASLDRAAPLRRLGGMPLALLDIDLVYRTGSRLVVAAEPEGPNVVLVAREGAREAWRIPGLAARHEVLLRRSDDKLIAVDDTQVLVIEEEGQVSARLPLKGPRSGTWTELPGGRLLVATQIGLELLQYGPGGTRLVASPFLVEAGPAVAAAIGGDLVLARADRGLDLVAWSADPPRSRWHATLARRGVLIATGQGLAAIADETGGLTVLRLADGQVLRRLVHGTPLAAAPLIQAGMLVVTDLTGAMAGYRLP